MSAEIIEFGPRQQVKSLMAAYYAECRKNGLPVHPDKGKLSDPGVVLTADGDLINVGTGDAE